MQFHVPPENQGQIVEVSYSTESPDELVMRVEDRSDRSVAYYVTPWTPKLNAWAESDGPWNTEPPIDRGSRKWKKVSEDQIVEP
jgi:hypothetical protein